MIDDKSDFIEISFNAQFNQSLFQATGDEEYCQLTIYRNGWLPNKLNIIGNILIVCRPILSPLIFFTYFLLCVQFFFSGAVVN